MKSEYARSGTPEAPAGAAAPGVDRRRLLEAAAGVGAMAALGAGMGAGPALAAGPAKGRAALASSRLADGAPFPRWEQPLSFSRTYYVDNGSPAADTLPTKISSRWDSDERGAANAERR